jgi:rare lipoprotein A
MTGAARTAAVALVLLLAACAGAPSKAPPPAAPQAAQPQPSTPRRSPYAPAQEDPGKRGDYVAGGLYAPHIRDSAPDDLPDVDLIPEPEVRAEPRSRYGNRDYAVLGKRYKVMDAPDGYVEQGLASYYGKKFHGRRTSSLEVYDMYTFSAAHKTLPLPSYARVTNLANGRSVVVRVNDRGPFHAGRIIDLSYAAAVKLGVHKAGVARVEVRALEPGETPAGANVAAAAPATSAPARMETVAPAAPSALDRMVAALPIASANAGERPPTTVASRQQASGPANDGAALPVAASAPAGTAWRFDMRQDGRVMSADEFDAWMKSRQVRVATGQPGQPRPRAAAAAPMEPAAVPSDAARPAQSTAGASASASANLAPSPPPVTPVAAGVTLQVASFAARANAERALAMLQGAGIGNARLVDAIAAGQPVWRLRVGPVDQAGATELDLRVRGLGFGPPNIVRD